MTRCRPQVLAPHVSACRTATLTQTLTLRFLDEETTRENRIHQMNGCKGGAKTGQFFGGRWGQSARQPRNDVAIWSHRVSALNTARQCVCRDGPAVARAARGQSQVPVAANSNREGLPGCPQRAQKQVTPPSPPFTSAGGGYLGLLALRTAPRERLSDIGFRRAHRAENCGLGPRAHL